MNATELRAFISGRFSDDELRALAFDLDIPFEDLGAPDIGKTARIQALIEWCIRHECIGDLERAARLARGNTVQGMADASGYAMTMDYAQIQRLIAVTDEMNKKMSQIGTDIALLQRDVNDLKQQFAELEERTAITPPVSWQSWAVAVIGLLMSVVLILSLVNLR